MRYRAMERREYDLINEIEDRSVMEGGTLMLQIINGVLIVYDPYDEVFTTCQQWVDWARSELDNPVIVSDDGTVYSTEEMTRICDSTIATIVDWRDGLKNFKW